MTQRLVREIEQLKRKVIALGTKVEEQVRRAVNALLTCDQEMANSVWLGDSEIDSMEVDIEEDCLKILALHQPVAKDLRFLVAVMKLNNDLERIADLAGGVSRNTIANWIPQHAPFKEHLAELGRKTQAMLKSSLDALVGVDAEAARNVLKMDDEIDKINRSIGKATVEAIKSGDPEVEKLLAIRSAAKNLERLADHATNIAEDVIYLAEGDIVRHTKA